MNQRTKEEKDKNNVIKVPQFELIRLCALCDEIMHSLCQAKALLEPVNEEDFFQRLEVEVLRNYFYELDTIIESALSTKEKITTVLDDWGKRKESLEKSMIEEWQP